ncbi:hypothetical protein [Gemmobacter denitrificans]|uniref:Uncharacterized protein n=1 Tax=Gemmobacter denitrificans TaxID=3123040 RepID=A0ABU8BYW0_9RHOB
MIRAFLLACILYLLAPAPGAHDTTRTNLQLQRDKGSRPRRPRCVFGLIHGFGRG